MITKEILAEYTPRIAHHIAMKYDYTTLEYDIIRENLDNWCLAFYIGNTILLLIRYDENDISQLLNSNYIDKDGDAEIDAILNMMKTDGQTIQDRIARCQENLKGK